LDFWATQGAAIEWPTKALPSSLEIDGCRWWWWWVFISQHWQDRALTKHCSLFKFAINHTRTTKDLYGGFHASQAYSNKHWVNKVHVYLMIQCSLVNRRVNINLLTALLSSRVRWSSLPLEASMWLSFCLISRISFLFLSWWHDKKNYVIKQSNFFTLRCMKEKTTKKLKKSMFSIKSSLKIKKKKSNKPQSLSWTAVFVPTVFSCLWPFQFFSGRLFPALQSRPRKTDKHKKYMVGKVEHIFLI
jgi:hypothetical protein